MGVTYNEKKHMRYTYISGSFAIGISGISWVPEKQDSGSTLVVIPWHASDRNMRGR